MSKQRAPLISQGDELMHAIWAKLSAAVPARGASHLADHRRTADHLSRAPNLLVQGTICEGLGVAAGNAEELAAVTVKGRARALLAILTAIVVAGSLLSSSVLVSAQSSMEKQAQCELSAIRDTRSAVGVQFIRSACNWLALNGDSLLNESSKNYYLCLARQLSGVQTDQAAGAIVSACRTSHPQ
jgi:hypothetical protein